MPLTLKKKIAIGVVFLFTLLLLVGVSGFFFINKAISDQKTILKNNYETLEYARNMLQAMDSPGGMTLFEKNLQSQEKNITESGEADATKSLRRNYNRYQTDTGSTDHRSAIRKDINRIMEINLSAINQKNRTVGKNAEDARFVITLLLTICALLGFTFVYNFPGYIANPVKKLTEGIKAISGKQYNLRIHLDRTDEFGEMAVAFNQMAEELDKYEHSNLARILFEKQRAETVINSLRDASIGIDNNKRILFANPLALKFLNLNEAAVLGKKINQLAEQNDLLRFLLDEKSNQPFKIVLDNREQFFSKETVDINNNEGTIGTMIVLKNITPYKELDVAKTHFIATVSHELKTPLASSDFSLKLLEDRRIGPLNTEQQQLIQNIRDNNRRLLKILSELLDISQVESGRIQLNITAVQPKIVIQNAATALSTSLEQKKVGIEITIDENLPPVLADEEKITWVLINFLTNAIKYSPESSTIRVSTSLQEQNILFEVIDQGRGIAQEHLAKIFDRYYQIPGTEKSGTGLGLSICKEFIEAMNGNIGVKSALGEGSRFYFTLPAKSNN